MSEPTNSGSNETQRRFELAYKAICDTFHDLVSKHPGMRNSHFITAATAYAVEAALAGGVDPYALVSSFVRAVEKRYERIIPFHHPIGNN